MSFRNDNLKKIESNPQVLEVTVHSDPRDPGAPIFPQTITLTNAVHTVHWLCVGLARGERLQIHFPQDSNGPFLSLESAEQAPQEVNGYGNRGPGETLKEYEYEARILKQRKVVRTGLGHLTNKATKRINHPHTGGPGDPPPEPFKPPA